MIKVRLFKKADLKVIISLEKQYFNSISEEDFIQYYVENPLIKIYIIELNNIFAGYGIIWLDKEKFQIYSMYIIEEFRRKNIAYKSLVIIENLLGEKGVLEATLEVNEKNLKAIGLYEKLGYKTISRRKAYYANNEDALLMYKEIGK